MTDIADDTFAVNDEFDSVALFAYQMLENKVRMSDAHRANGFLPEEPLAVEHLNYELNRLDLAINELRSLRLNTHKLLMGETAKALLDLSAGSSWHDDDDWHPQTIMGNVSYPHAPASLYELLPTSRDGWGALVSKPIDGDSLDREVVMHTPAGMSLRQRHQSETPYGGKVATKLGTSHHTQLMIGFKWYETAGSQTCLLTSDDSWETVGTITRTQSGFTNPRFPLKPLYDATNSLWIVGGTTGVRTLPDADWPGTTAADWDEQTLDDIFDDLPMAYGDTQNGVTFFAVVDPSTKMLKIAFTEDGADWTGAAQYDVNLFTSDEYRVIGAKFISNGDFVIACASNDSDSVVVLQFLAASVLAGGALNILDLARSWSFTPTSYFRQYATSGGSGPTHDYDDYTPTGTEIYTEHLAVINDVLVLVVPDEFAAEIDLGPANSYRIACNVRVLVPEIHDFTVEERKTFERCVIVPLNFGQALVREGNADSPCDFCHVSTNGRGLMVSFGMHFAEGAPGTGVVWSRCVF